MDKMVAMCGLVCTDCEAYKATQANDMAWLQRVADQWKVEYNAPNITVEGVACDGCVSGSKRLCGNCYECGIRLCGLEKGVANCGECADYESCQRIQDFFKMVPAAKIVLDEVHAAR